MDTRAIPVSGLSSDRWLHACRRPIPDLGFGWHLRICVIVSWESQKTLLVCRAACMLKLNPTILTCSPATNCWSASAASLWQGLGTATSGRSCAKLITSSSQLSLESTMYVQPQACGHCVVRSAPSLWALDCIVRSALPMCAWCCISIYWRWLFKLAYS